MSPTSRDANESPGEASLWEADLPVLLADVAPSPPETRQRPAAARGASPTGAPLGSWATEDQQGDAEEVLAAAHEQAASILDEARQGAAEIREASRREAIETIGAQQAAALSEIIGLIRADFQAQFTEKMNDVELDAARLCVALVENVIRRKIAEDDEFFVDVVRDGLTRMVGAKAITVRVSPDCEGALRAAQDKLAAELPSSVSVDIRPDDAVSPGGALLQSANGEIDLQIESQLARLGEAAEAALLRESGQEAES